MWFALPQSNQPSRLVNKLLLVSSLTQGSQAKGPRHLLLWVLLLTQVDQVAIFTPMSLWHPPISAAFSRRQDETDLAKVYAGPTSEGPKFVLTTSKTTCSLKQGNLVLLTSGS